MNIYPATDAHAAILAQLDASRPFSAHWSIAQWQAEIAQPSSWVWVATRNEFVVGFLALRGAAGMYEILNLAVEADQCRQGIAEALLLHALENLHQQGGEQITLEVSTDNQPAQGLYQKVGFHVVGRRKQFYADGSDALIMGRAL